MENHNAQDYINKKYPINGACNRSADSENKGKRREEITKLDISKGKAGGGETIFGNSKLKKLYGNLKLEGFTNLRVFKIYSHQLTSLDVSTCRYLEELDCHDNELTSLNINGCINLKRINCSNNSGLNVININNCPNLDIKQSKTDLMHDYRTRKLVKRLRSEPKQNSSQKVKQEQNANGNQERNTNGKQERNTNNKQERNTNVKQERNTNKRIEQELSIKRSRLKKLHFDLSLKFKEYLARTVTKYLFKSHKMFVEGTDVEGYYSKNLAKLRNALGSDTEGHKILDQIISVQNEIIDLEKELESTTSQVGSPPPYYAIQTEFPRNNYNFPYMPC
ncbi:13989_t:CDS:1 [Cetraspora pellucida]|uniref:13989_t:CDS:1 n=1 Tax=Cetraspora pellucida TaxID=1433469 RepID=A0A9N9HZ66_9GLOM|nr:13989_t:CDS:1 [Cetraspora pellucida]